MAKSSPDYLIDNRDGATALSFGRAMEIVMLTFGRRSRQVISTSVVSLLFCCIAFAPLPCSVIEAKPTTVVPDDRQSDQVNSLISRLDSKDFSQREKAAQDLIEIGEKAIRPLALKSFDCSPEACWRIRKILEQISTRGNELIFYKTTGILQLRFDSSNSEMEQRLSVLEAKWKVQRKKKAISALRKKGAVVEDPLEGKENPNVAQPQPGGEIFLGGGRGVVIVNGRVIELSPNGTPQTNRTPKRKPRKLLSDTAAKKEIERILDSDLDQARKIAIGDNDEPSDSADRPDQLIDVQRQMLARRHFLGAASNPAAQGVSVELGDDFEGDAGDLKDLAGVARLKEIKLVNRDLDASSLKHIAATNTVTKLVIENCEVDSEEIRNAKWSKSVQEVELAKLDLNNEFIASFEAIPSLSLLSFRECELDPEKGFETLKRMKSLRGLQFTGLDIPGEMFESFADMKQLSFVNLSYCKFKTKDYRALKTRRPNLQISFTAKAFLGVRGPVDLARIGPGAGCVISEVIAGSGAEKGGMKVDDIIETVNGEKVELFEDLRLHIAQHRPGEKLMVTVKRSGKPLDLEIELSSFDQVQP